MLKLGLIQPNFQTGPKHLNSFYLPYTLGCLWSYVSQYSDITDNYNIGAWLFNRLDLDTATKKFSDCDVIFASMYVWNTQYTHRLLSRIKQNNPDVVIVCGGPQIPWRDKNFFLEHPYIDTIVINEGEQAALDVLRSILAGDSLPKTLQFDRLKELDELPSPYLTGVFDDLIAEHPDIEWVPTLETDRGCPFKCTFCDWGSATGSKMHKLNIDRIRSEINWFADNNMPFLSMTTSNFGAFKQRDKEVTNIIVECNKRTGMPTAISTSYGKNNADTVFEISKMLLDAGIQTGAAISFQTTTPEVLKNIKRDNMKINRVSEVTEKAKAYNMPVLTELIMGLPGETYDTWVDSVCEVVANKIINLDIFFLQLIENAPMNVSDTDKFQLETFQAYDYFYETSTSVEEELGQGTAEIVNVIKSTSTLTPDELYACNEFSWFVVGTHCYGLTTHISDYLYDKKGITYQEFYLDLLDHVKQDITVNQWFSDYKNSYEFWKAMGYTHSKIGGYTIQGGWKGINSLMPVIQFNKYLNKFLDLVCEFLTRYDLSDQVISDYRKIVNVYVKQFGKYLTTPKTVKLQSDILGVSEITASDRYDHYPETLSEHIDFMFFARRRNWYLNKF
jgi:hypothetical protein